MKKLLLIAFCFLFTYSTNAQEFPNDLGYNPKYDQHQQNVTPSFIHNLDDPAFQYAVGIEYAYPAYTLSFKYAITDASVIQALASPFSANYGHYDYAFYGLRYIYRFPFDNFPFYGPFTASYPYLYAGGGLLAFNYPVYDDNGLFANKTSGSAFGYSIGAGYELIFGKHIAIGIELGYGAMAADLGSVEDVFTYSLGAHYYFSGHGYHAARVKSNPEEEANPDEQEQPAATEEQPVEDQPPVKKSRKQRVRQNDDE